MRGWPNISLISRCLHRFADIIITNFCWSKNYCFCSCLVVVMEGGTAISGQRLCPRGMAGWKLPYRSPWHESLAHWQSWPLEDCLLYVTDVLWSPLGSSGLPLGATTIYYGSMAFYFQQNLQLESFHHHCQRHRHCRSTHFLKFG